MLGPTDTGEPAVASVPSAARYLSTPLASVASKIKVQVNRSTTGYTANVRNRNSSITNFVAVIAVFITGYGNRHGCHISNIDVIRNIDSNRWCFGVNVKEVGYSGGIRIL